MIPWITRENERSDKDEKATISRYAYLLVNRIDRLHHGSSGQTLLSSG